MPNLPSEEIFSSPDPARVEGVVRATKPLVVGGSIIRGLEVEFRGGRAVRIDAEPRAPTSCAATPPATRAPRAWARSPWSTARAASAPLDTVFFDTLLDENAA